MAFGREASLGIRARNPRGSTGVDSEIQNILPSSLEALCVGGEKMRLKGKIRISYIHNWQR